MSKMIRYDEEFQRNAVNLWIRSGKPARQVAEELGVSDASLHRWKEKYINEEDSPQREAAEAEIERMRREIIELKQEREILKKSVAIFLKPLK